MNKQEVAKLGAAMAARLKAKAKDDGVDTRFYQMQYVLERLVGRLCLAAPDAFVMKGGVLFMIADDPSRPTEDVDLQWNTEAAEDKVRPVVEGAMDALTEDGILFPRGINVKTIRHGLSAGIRITADAMLGGTRVHTKLDVACGDVITPAPVLRRMKPILPKHCEPFYVPCYPWETVVAEKVHGIREHGILNTRYKDFYDLVSVSRCESMDGQLLVKAIRATFDARNANDRKVPLDGKLPAIDDPDFGVEKSSAFDAWRKKMPWLKHDVGSLQECLAEVDAFVRRPYMSAVERVGFEMDWTPGQGWCVPAPAPTSPPLSGAA